MARRCGAAEVPGPTRPSSRNSNVRLCRESIASSPSGASGRVPHMVIGRSNRRGVRGPRALDAFGSGADAALDVLELVEFAWHDCYGEITPPDEVIEDIFVVANGNIVALARAARLAVEDFRDLRISANAVRAETP